MRLAGARRRRTRTIRRRTTKTHTPHVVTRSFMTPVGFIRHAPVSVFRNTTWRGTFATGPIAPERTERIGASTLSRTPGEIRMAAGSASQPSELPALRSITAVLVVVLIGLIPVGSLTAAERGGAMFSFDLSTGSVRGYSVLGTTYASVVKALGKPDHRSIGKDYGTAGYGELQNGARPLTISFTRRRGALRAWSVAVATPRASEVRLGRILRSSPKRIQSRISRGYSGQLRLSNAYRCRTKPLRCRGD